MLCAVNKLFWTERLLPTQISLWSLFYHEEEPNYYMAVAYAGGVQVTAGNNENQHGDNDLSLPQQTEHLSLPSPLLLKTPSQFLKEEVPASFKYYLKKGMGCHTRHQWLEPHWFYQLQEG